MRKFGTVALVILFLSSIAGFAVGAADTPVMSYTFCVNWKTQALSLADQNVCPKGSRKIRVNEAGLKGETGPQGVEGIQGIQGPKGETGSQGLAGPIGETGARGLDGTTSVVIQNVTKNVYDLNGALLGEFLSIDGSGTVTVRRSGSVVTYGGSAYAGNVIVGGWTYYMDPACSGSKYATLANRDTYTVENPYVGLDTLSRTPNDYAFTIGYTPGAQINTTSNLVFAIMNGICIPTSDPAFGDGPVTKVKLLTLLAIPTKAVPPYVIR